MSDSDKMRADFEKWAVENLPYSLERSKFSGEYKWPQMTMHFETYLAGRKAEREAILSEFDSVADGYTWQVRMAFNAMAAKIWSKPEGER